MRIKTLNIIILTVVSLTLKVQSAPLTDIGDVFENDKSWVTAPKLFIEADRARLARVEREEKRVDWVRPAVSFDELVYGVRLSEENVKSGMYSVKWASLNKYPTLACYEITGNWAAVRNISFQCFSERATQNIITFAVRADNSDTPYLDYWTFDFVIDWTGWKQLSFNTEDFGRMGEPVSWGSIEGLFFFSKNNRRTPDPATVLYFDDMKLDDEKSAIAAQGMTDEDADSVVLLSGYCDAPVVLNHESKEIAVDGDKNVPIVQRPFFQGSRSIDGYYPKYDPGYVSFCPQGRASIHSPGAVEWLDGSGKWQKKDIKEAAKTFAVQNGWDKITLECSDERAIRFDSEGHIYVLESVKRLDKDGKETNWQDRATLLFYASNCDDQWQVYKLPGRRGCFEKLDGHNQDALNNPPVILLTDYFYFAEADHNGYLLLPEKTDDGRLDLSEKICYAKNSLAGPVHSGKGNFAITQGDNIFIQFSTMPPPAMGDAPGAMMAEPDKQWKKDMPLIPADHPAHEMLLADRDKIVKATDGLPAFVIAYNRKTKELSDAVFVGFGGKHLDNHNWAAITADSKGILHVVISGHIDPLVYTHSLRPGDITAWSKPVYIPKAPGSDEYSKVSYASLNCDIHDNLLVVVRSDTDFYNHRLGLMFKPAGKPWAAERSLMVPYKDSYHVWRHGVAYDSTNDRFFVSFFEQSWQQQLRRDDYLFCRFIWPDAEKDMTVNYKDKNKEALAEWQRGHNAGLPSKGAPMFTTGASDMTIIVSDDSGKNWHLATTQDFSK